MSRNNCFSLKGQVKGLKHRWLVSEFWNLEWGPGAAHLWIALAASHQPFIAHSQHLLKLRKGVIIGVQFLKGCGFPFSSLSVFCRETPAQSKLSSNTNLYLAAVWVTFLPFPGMDGPTLCWGGSTTFAWASRWPRCSTCTPSAFRPRWWPSFSTSLSCRTC